MHPNEQLILRLYEHFAARDAAGMWDCYTPDATFSDGIFTELHGDDVRAMWQMLCERGSDLQIHVSDVSADDSSGRAHWEATYTFPRTGRRVHNSVDARFHFRDGRIERHHDSFSLRRWMAMALGWKGTVLGLTPKGRAVAQRQAKQGLAAYVRGQSSTTPGQDSPDR